MFNWVLIGFLSWFCHTPRFAQEHTPPSCFCFKSQSIGFFFDMAWSYTCSPTCSKQFHTKDPVLSRSKIKPRTPLIGRAAAYGRIPRYGFLSFILDRFASYLSWACSYSPWLRVPSVFMQVSSSTWAKAAPHTPFSGVWDTPHSGVCPYTAVLFIVVVLFTFWLRWLPRSVSNILSYVILVFGTRFYVRSISFRLVNLRVI